RVPGAGAARAGFEGEALDRRFKERLDEVVQARPADVGAVQAAVLWACGPGQISHEDEAGGVFTQGLVAALQAGRRTTGELVAAAAARVPVELRGKQEPVLSGPANLRLAEDIGPPRERLRAGTVKKNPKDGAAVVWVPAGEFRMGDAAGDSDEKPVRRVRLTRGYWLYRTEVTNAQYRRFLEKNPGHREPSYWNNARFNGSGQPVVGVSWEDAAAYCEWAGARLPTEAEWEYAARGPQGRKYPWGEQAPNASLAVFGDTGQPAAVGSKPGGASWCGALDLAGNVWEWCADWYDGNFYRGRPDPDVDPVRSIKDSSQYRVLRGGSWSNVALDLRSANRNYFEPDFRYVIFGFRAVAAAAED
ncbi:MAG: formylglycine-generating enzyme family protein, partial [Armatimonadetes bacterium]|nr:formylglycine-generating enzyme family protein [Armatimonadota bacterium]